MDCPHNSSHTSLPVTRDIFLGVELNNINSMPPSIKTRLYLISVLPRQDAALPDQDDRQHPGAGGPAGEQADHPPRGGGGRQLHARPGGPRGGGQSSCEQPCQVRRQRSMFN